MMARFPAPMAGWSRMLPTVVDTILKALAPALPDRTRPRIMGTLGGAHDVLRLSIPSKRRNFVLQTIEGGGWGARPCEDGESASVSVCQGDVRNSPVETIELKTPVVVDKRALRNGSGGAGKYRGGLGMMTQMTNLVEGRWSLSNTGRRIVPPWGIAGGTSGARVVQLHAPTRRRRIFRMRSGRARSRRRIPASWSRPAAAAAGAIRSSAIRRACAIRRARGIHHARGGARRSTAWSSTLPANRRRSGDARSARANCAGNERSTHRATDDRSRPDLDQRLSRVSGTDAGARHRRAHRLFQRRSTTCCVSIQLLYLSDFRRSAAAIPVCTGRGRAAS